MIALWKWEMRKRVKHYGWAFILMAAAILVSAVFPLGLGTVTFEVAMITSMVGAVFILVLLVALFSSIVGDFMAASGSFEKSLPLPSAWILFSKWTANLCLAAVSLPLIWLLSYAVSRFHTETTRFFVINGVNPVQVLFQACYGPLFFAFCYLTAGSIPIARDLRIPMSILLGITLLALNQTILRSLPFDTNAALFLVLKGISYTLLFWALCAVLLRRFYETA